MITEPGRPPTEYRSTASEVVIGRSPSCEVVIDRPFVSGRHLRILGGVVAHDLGSTNGTFLDGRLLECPEWIVDRMLTLGGGAVEVRVVTGRAEAPEGPAPGSAAAPGAAHGGDGESQPGAPPGPDAPIDPAVTVASAAGLSRPIAPLDGRAGSASALSARHRASIRQTGGAVAATGDVAEFFGSEALRFVREIEALVARTAQRMAQRLEPPDHDALPRNEQGGQAKALLAAVAAQPHDTRPRARFLAHLDELRRSLEESTVVYQRASLRLVEDLRVSLGPTELAATEPLPKLTRALGRGDAELYRRARRRLDAMTPAVVAARLDDLVRAARGTAGGIGTGP